MGELAMKLFKLAFSVTLILCSSCGFAETIRVAGWPMSNSSAVTDPSKRSALYAALGDQDVDFVYICNGKAADEYSCETYGIIINNYSSIFSLFSSLF